MDFTTRHGYVHNFGEPRSFFTDDWRAEMFLIEITFDNDFQQKKKPFSFPLPYGLVLGDDQETIYKKLGGKPAEKGEGLGYALYYFIKEDFRIQTAVDDNKKLIWLRIRPLDLKYKKRIALKATLKVQDQNIKPKNAKGLMKLKASMPTKEWKRRMKQGDTIFTERNISATETALSEFLEQLSLATTEGKADKVHAAVKKVVLAFNKLNVKYGFIDTMEREELVEYIQSAVGQTGFVVEKGLDLTEEWREW